MSLNILIFCMCDVFSGVLTTRMLDDGSYEDCMATANVRNVSARGCAYRITIRPNIMLQSCRLHRFPSNSFRIYTIISMKCTMLSLGYFLDYFRSAL